MWHRKKLIQTLRYYSTVSIIMCLFLAIFANNYFPPLDLLTNPTIDYLEEQKSMVQSEDEKEKLSTLIKYQKIILKNDEYTSSLKFNVMSSSILFLLLSVILYILSTRQLKLQTNNKNHSNENII